MAQLVTANSADVVEANLTLPRIGAGIFDLVLNTDDLSTFGAGARVELVITPPDAPALTLVGSVIPGRAAVFLDTVLVRVVAGGGGLAKAAAAKFYQAGGLTVRIVLGDLLRDAGETLSTTADAGVLGQVLDPSWTTPAMPTGDVIRQLLETAGAESWRLLPDGTLWIGSETWPEAPTDDLSQQALYPVERREVFAVAAPSLLPGQAIAGQHVGRVEHQIRPGYIRSTVWYE